MSIAAASDLGIAPARPLLMPLVSATVCVALADWLFCGGWEVGISLPLFLAVLGVVAVADHLHYYYSRLQENWRAWGFRRWRLERYLANHPYEPQTPSNSDKG
jgi:hypothetical protein